MLDRSKREGTNRNKKMYHYSAVTTLVLRQIWFFILKYTFILFCRVFAIQLFDKIAEKIQSLSCPVETKIQLLPILKHMGSDAPTAAIVTIVESLSYYINHK